MKRFHKLVAMLLVIALAIPMLLTSNTAAAAKKAGAKKVTAKSIMDKCNKASEGIHNLSIDLKLKVDMGTIGKMIMTAKGNVQDNPVGADLDIVMDMSQMKSLFAMIGNNDVTEDDLKMKLKMYAETTDEGFFVYESNGSEWIKAKVANSMDTDNVMGLDTKDIQNAFLKGCKVKETKKAYVLTSNVKITNKMVNQVIDAAKETAEQFDEENVAVVRRMFSNTKPVKFSMTIDKKTFMLTSMDCDATAFVNSIMDNVANDEDTDAAVKPLLAALKMKNCSFTMKLSNYGKADKVVIPEEAKAAAEQNAREAVDNTVDKATGEGNADGADAAA